jgi:MFS transporter, OFA family, oxalate/formate antiporter
MAIAYGAILTAWSVGGIVGPQMIALLKKQFADEPAKAAELAFWLSAAALGIGLTLAISWRDVAQSQGDCSD